MAKAKSESREQVLSPKSFEEKMDRLEEIVRVLEGQDRPLEESMALFEEGMKLSNECRDILEKTEKKITVLLSREEGEVPFSEEEKTEERGQEPSQDG
ncbi:MULTISPECIES: exodeoxyribonuclease VII small subunit [Leptospirillum]|uniref:Exodeoxyribonuclease 7 small subunit n=3 Tax=Leptospirillum ferriphilum TaxID=178606 RepID=A0A059XTW6_9BACT|nr:MULTISPECIES: exodeoxyribonuclease VII small subunit [Leptospirillum]AFS53152.1 exodeoxyribonuclease VII small subunit [Leptospirillum ferriphilum ML-04]AIA30243.1 exodeoxyribonuclease VII small subunit [Leptospirillum ferriphilum YSK]EAY57333.1 MAG: Exodeoxyribonuclease VII small subunit [Leptospirillum rubarum]EIJ77422.1 MAG: Exodeoxyribonuclease VII small subunit [Leptospirillum sp. Group II 'C75']